LSCRVSRLIDEDNKDVEQPTQRFVDNVPCVLICIDELLEVGEKMTLLTSQHAFHGIRTKPWLMTGLSGLCKNNVLNSGQDTDSEGSIDASDENAITATFKN
jgi:hypothetical protein